MTKSEMYFVKVNDLKASGTTRTQAFSIVAAEFGVSPNTVQQGYYRIRKRGGHGGSLDGEVRDGSDLIAAFETVISDLQAAVQVSRRVLGRLSSVDERDDMIREAQRQLNAVLRPRTTRPVRDVGLGETVKSQPAEVESERIA